MPLFTRLPRAAIVGTILGSGLTSWAWRSRGRTSASGGPTPKSTKSSPGCPVYSASRSASPTLGSQAAATVLHLGYLPVVLEDACGAGSEEAARHSLELLDHAGDALIINAATISVLFREAATKA